MVFVEAVSGYNGAIFFPVLETVMKTAYLKHVKKALVLVAALGLATQVLAISEARKAEMSERLKPVGEVCVQGDPCADAVASTGSSDTPKSPKDIYNASCMGCHTTGAAGAPKIGDKAAWSDRLAKGMDTLNKNAIEGFNAMPAKGLCMSCSDDDVIATVEYIINKSK